MFLPHKKVKGKKGFFFFFSLTKFILEFLIISVFLSFLAFIVPVLFL